MNQFLKKPSLRPNRTRLEPSLMSFGSCFRPTFNRTVFLAFDCLELQLSRCLSQAEPPTSRRYWSMLQRSHNSQQRGSVRWNVVDCWMYLTRHYATGNFICLENSLQAFSPTHFPFSSLYVPSLHRHPVRYSHFWKWIIPSQHWILKFRPRVQLVELGLTEPAI